ncbi:MAG: thioredoxin family protein [Planctomycetaceae bacterium]|nr:thioredoxin family protein [Planctomycetaceae bacterium]
MCGPAVPLALQAVMLVSGAQTYVEAYEDTQTSGKPLVVLVGADWCPGCVTMKSSVMPRMQESGYLRHVNYAQIDAESEFAGQLLRGSSIPQLIVFSQSADGRWHREQIIGATSDQAVAAAIHRAVGRSARPVSTAISHYPQ